MSDLIFANREEAGTRLGSLLAARYELGSEALILGLVRGGAVIADSAAKQCSLPWDVIVVRKLGAPSQPEYAIGAYAEAGGIILNHDAIKQLGIGKKWLDEAIINSADSCANLAQELRGSKPPVDLEGKLVVLIDDGIATGLSMLAAIESAQANDAKEVLVAAPVIAPATKQLIEDMGVTCVCLTSPRSFRAVGQFYRDFQPVTTEVVKHLLDARSAD